MNSGPRASASSPPADRVGRLLGEANALAASGRLGAALAACDQALTALPGALDALKMRGEILTRLGRPAEALASFERGLAQAPGDVWLTYSRGVVLNQLGRLQEALASHERALGIQPDYIPAVFGRAVVLMNAGHLAEAAGAYDTVLAHEPRHIPSLLNRGICLQRLGRNEAALASFDAVLSLEPNNPNAMNSRGLALQALLRADEALASFDAAIAAAPALAGAHGNRGILLNQLGRKDEAIAEFERSVQLAPDQPRLYHHLASARRFQAGDPHIAAMQRLAEGTLPVEGQIELRFALGKALADAGDQAGAFEQLRLANALKRRTFHYDEAAILGELDQIADAFDRAFLDRMEGQGNPDPTPVLIVGMPRSGSTLIEQILATHPQVYAAGEPPDLEELIQGRLGGAPRTAAAEWPAETLRRLGGDYVQRLRAFAPGAARIVDKTLVNLRYCGLVHAALPKARIIHARRSAMDTSVSCYSLLFGGDQAFAYDLGEIGRYYLACERLMGHWRELLGPEVLLDVQYEDLVADPEVQVRRLLAHCGLDWDPDCLQFHRTRRQVRTSSVSQVREPLYTSSVGAWRRFEPWLGPLSEVLGQGGAASD